MPGYRLGSRPERHDTFEFRSVVLGVRNRSSMTVEVTLAWTPSRSVPRRHDAVDPIRSEEAIIDTLTKAVLVNRIAEVEIGVLVVVPQRCRGHAHLIGRAEP